MTSNRLTDRDRLIIKYFEQYKYATAHSIQKMFFAHQQFGYNIARRRLLLLKELDYIKIHKDMTLNRNIYIWNEDKWKVPSDHRLITLAVLAEMKYLGFDVEVFEVEKSWASDKFRSDAFTIFTVNNRRYHFFVEIQTSNNYHNLEKYDQLYSTGSVQQYYGKDFFPKRILLVTDRQFSNINLEHCQAIQIDTKLNGFATILL